jgi:hypothetical protein
MRSIAKTLLLAPSTKKWLDYTNHFRDFFAGRSNDFDQLIDFLSEFYQKFQGLPHYTAVEAELAAAGDTALLDFVRGLAQASAVPVQEDDTAFASHLRVTKVACFHADIKEAAETYEATVDAQPKHLPALKVALNGMLATLYSAEQRALGDEAAISELLFGEHAQNKAREHYRAIVEGQALGYALPFPSLSAVRVKPGDLVAVGAFTSQGKSAMLRALAHHFLTEHALNVVFMTLEMSADVVMLMFRLLHANDARRFQYPPKILHEDYKNGTLTDEQQDFLFNVAVKDLTENTNYGSLLVEQPGQSRFTMADLAQRIAAIGQTIMPVHVLVIDYVTYMHPVPIDRIIPPQTADYNQLIKELKRLCLVHRNAKGEKAPIICFTAAQISRRAYAEALKQDNRYGIDAFSTYTEIERSADIAMTTLLTDPMRAASQLQLQVHKNRDGAVPPDPLLLYIDLKHGMGIEELGSSHRTATSALETVRMLQSLNI